MNRKLASAALAHHDGRNGLHSDAHAGHAAYQSSVMAALLAGIYDGEMTVAELLTHGDFGLGTFNHLDGEMVVLDGTCYHLRSDGGVGVADPQDRTPFALVTDFSADTEFDASPSTRQELARTLDERAASSNLLYAIRVDGTFSEMRTRTVSEQHKPYPPLTEATAHQAEMKFDEVSGTLVGFRAPDYEQGITVAGYHLHFIDESRTRGGHVLDFELTRATVAISVLSDLYLSLPRRGPFLSAELGGDDINEQIHRAED
jgi:acetolactate decarboxylase